MPSIYSRVASLKIKLLVFVCMSRKWFSKTQHLTLTSLQRLHPRLNLHRVCSRFLRWCKKPHHIQQKATPTSSHFIYYFPCCKIHPDLIWLAKVSCHVSCLMLAPGLILNTCCIHSQSCMCSNANFECNRSVTLSLCN